MNRTKFVTLLFVSLLSLCGCRENKSVEDPVDVGGVNGLALYGGRERMLAAWNGVDEGVTSMQLLWNGGKLFREVRFSGTGAGSAMIEDMPEGEYDFEVLCFDAADNASAKGRITGRSYGARFERGLANRAPSSMSRVGGELDVVMPLSNSVSLVAQEFEYRTASGATKSVELAVERGREQRTRIYDFGGEGRYRSVYDPSQQGVDRFYSPWDSLKVADSAPVEPNRTQPGYRGIWFTIGQAASSYGPKYSGGLGTYTMKHIPMAVYAEKVDKSFFVYGGTPSETDKYLLCMIGCYDHASGKVCKPVVVYDKNGVNDPHDDPTVQLDKDGYVWVFVAGRANTRKGIRYRSKRPYDITAFDSINADVMAYPQPHYSPERGFLLLYTRYDGVRQLFWRTSADGVNWSSYSQLASIKDGTETKSGHYQISNSWGQGRKVATAFNRHKNGNVDTRTNIYYLQTTDWGETWTTADGKVVKTPVTTLDSECRVRDYQSEERNCYIKDVNFDSEGNPIILYLTSDNHLTGPSGGERRWHTLYWTDGDWRESIFATSTHCYDSGSLWVDDDVWTVIAPTDAGPQYWGTGGEIVMWRSRDRGITWERVMNVTQGSERNHGYVRRPLYAHDPFYAFWADGNPDKLSISYLYFCDSKGVVRRLPYTMTEEWETPEVVNY